MAGMMMRAVVKSGYGEQLHEDISIAWEGGVTIKGMGSALAHPKMTVEEYLAYDRAAEFRNEYHDGEIFPLEAASMRHARISLNLALEFDKQLKSTSCCVTQAIRVRVNQRKFLYPDLLVYCGSPQLTDEVQDTITNPKVIVEILSPSTADYDFGTKFRLYQALDSFEEYLIVSQDQPRVEVSHRTPAGSWLTTAYEGLDAVCPLESLRIKLLLSDIYARLP